MKIVHTSPTFVPSLAEGVSKNVAGLVAAERARGHDARIAADPTGLRSLNRRRSLAAGAWQAHRHALRALREGADVVHCHASLPVLAGYARLARLRAGRRSPVVAHAWNALVEPSDAAASARRGDLWLHRLLNGAPAAAAGLGGLPHVVVSSEYQRRQLRRVPGLGRVHVVPSGVDTADYRPASPGVGDEARLRLGVTGDPVVLYYGHLSSWKGVDVLVEALPAIVAAHPRAQALLAVTPYGSGQEMLRRRIARPDLAGRVVLRGVDDVARLHAAADIAVVPARAAVGTAVHPNVLLECMAAGLPTVATRVGSIPEVVAHGQSGLLVPPGDADALAGALLLLADDRELRRRLGGAARQAMVASYDWSRVAEAMEEVYRVATDPSPRESPAVAPLGGQAGAQP